MEIEASDVEWEKEDGGNDLKDEIEEHGVNERLYLHALHMQAAIQF